MNHCLLERKLIFGLLFMISVTSLQIAYAEPEFSFEIGSSGGDDDELTVVLGGPLDGA